MAKTPVPASRYRAGDRDDGARAGKAADDRARRRVLADQAFPPPVRQAILAAVQRGTRVAEAARDLGVTVQAVYGLAGRDRSFADALDAAQRRAAPVDCPHGTPMGYRWYGCHCRACRAAKNGRQPIQTFGTGRAGRQQLRAELERIAVGKGFKNWEALIRGTRHLSGRQVARMVGRSGNAIARWRHLILRDEDLDRQDPRNLPIHKQSPAWDRWRQERAEAGGFASWEAAIRATAETSVPHIAKLLHVNPSVVYRWRGLLEGKD